MFIAQWYFPKDFIGADRRQQDVVPLAALGRDDAAAVHRLAAALGLQALPELGHLCVVLFVSPIELTHMQPNSLHKSPPNSPRSPPYRNISHSQPPARCTRTARPRSGRPRAGRAPRPAARSARPRRRWPGTAIISYRIPEIESGGY